MDQKVIANFKKLYTKGLFERNFEVAEATNFTLREFWKEHYHINCLQIIDKAWVLVTKRTINSVEENCGLAAFMDLRLRGLLLSRSLL